MARRSSVSVVSLFAVVLLCCTFSSVRSQLNQLMHNGIYVALNYDADTNLNGGPYTDSTNHSINFPGLALTDEMTFEFNFYWRGFLLGTGAARTPLFFLGDSNNYLFVTTRSNAPGFNVNAIPGLYLKTGTTTQLLVPFSGYIDNSWCYIAVAIRPNTAGQSYAFISSYGITGFIDGSIASFNTPMRLSQDIGTTTAYIGSIPDSAVNTAIGITAPWAGRIDEVRIWDQFIPAVTVIANRQISLNGNEPNLYAYWRFDEPSGTNVLDSAPLAGTQAGSLVDGPNASKGIQRKNQTATATQGALGPVKYTPLTVVKRELTPTGSLTFYAANNVDPVQDWNMNIVTYPPHSYLCVGDSCTINTNGSTPVAAIPAADKRDFKVTLTPRRGACGFTESGFIQTTQASESSNQLEVRVTVPKLSVTLDTPATRKLVPTTGGTLFFTGTNLGQLGPLDNNEEFKINGPFGFNLCKFPTVTAQGVRCTFDAGVGMGNIAAKLCDNVINVPNAFAYEAPQVAEIVGFNSTRVTIKGTGFGPNRTADFNFDNLRFFQTSGPVIPCTDIILVNDTFIICMTNQDLVQQQEYTLSLSIGGQQMNKTFTFQICNPACENGGKCIAFNTCNCKSTGFTGAICSQPLECQPACKHDGKCVEATDNSTKSLKCECPPEWTGEDCGDKANKGLPVPLIAGVVGGGGGAILILGAVVVVLLIRKARQPKRGGVNFIPLEKKDFTKIIWGEQLNQNPEKTSGNIKQLEELLVEDNLELAATISKITQITEADKIAKAMVVVFQDNDKVLHLLQAFIGEEVNSTESAGTLFRSNSMVSKMFKFYSRLIGLPYLYETIGPEINELIEDELGLEVDPEKMEEGTDLDEMRWTLMAQSQKILKSVLANIDKCPPQFRVLFNHISKCVTERFPGNVNTTIGGFIFLRFFCPAVSSPEAYGIVEEPPSASSRRLLILITKVLQNLSNDVEFGSKEPYMTKMNDFIHSNRSKLAQFYEKLIKPSAKPPVLCDLPKNMKAVSLAVLSNHLRDNLNKVEDPSLKSKLEGIVN